MSREDQITGERLKKLGELKKKGINPYPSSSEKEHSIEQCLKSKIGTNVKTGGRVLSRRDIGKITFAELMDFTGKIQIVLQEKETPDKEIEFFSKYIDLGDIIGVEGKIFKTKTGQISILVKKLKLLTKALLPLPSQWHGLQDKEERYRKRYLDLIMNPAIKEVFDKRAKIVDSIREFMKSKDFVEVQTPILQPIYGGASARPFISELNALKMKVYMRISNELYLKRLIVGGYERIFEFSPDFRNEGIDRTHNPEFTQVETMWAYADYKDNMNFAEEMITFVVKKVLGKTKTTVGGKDIDFKNPWKKTTFLNAIKEKTGVDFVKKNFEESKKAAIKLEVDVSKADTLGEIMIAVFE